jgi:hypothetical protein
MEPPLGGLCGAEEYNIFSMEPDREESVSIRSRVDDRSGGTSPHYLCGTRGMPRELLQKCLVKTKGADQCSYRLKESSPPVTRMI